MGEVLGPLLFIAIVVSSWILQARKERIEREQAKDLMEKRQRGLEDLPEETRRQLYGETGPREAVPKGGAKPSPESTGRPIAAEEFFDTLFGGKPRRKAEEDAEAGEDWSPVQPAPRRELQEAPRRTPQRRPASSTARETTPGRSTPPPIRRQPTAQPQRGAGIEQHREQRRAVARQREIERQLHEQRRTSSRQENALRSQQQEWEAKRRRELERKQQMAAAQRQQQRTAQPSMMPEPAMRGKALIGDLRDVRRAIILSEVLGTPKGLRDNVTPTLYADPTG
jgi:hypothetical protein